MEVERRGTEEMICHSTYRTCTEGKSFSIDGLQLETADEVAIWRHDPLEHNFGTTSDSCDASHSSERIQRMIEQRSDFSSDLEFRTAFSRDHWTEVNLQRVAHQEDFPAQDKLAELKEIWGHSLYLVKNGLVSLGRRIGEGGQAEIFEALLGKRPCGLIAKVFREGYPLSSLQNQCPMHVFELEGIGKYISRVFAGALLDNRRFAFLMLLYQEDLRSVIDRKMMGKNNQGPPFDANEALHYMIRIACGMKSLHFKNILHRDLKAANILVWSTADEHINSRDGREFHCAVADYECSIGVLGTGFWRAPEVLQAIKDRRDLEFTTKVDVYSYAMTCFEILTGCLPFEDHPRSDYDFVVSGNRPELPRHVSAQMRELLSRCWHAVPYERPEFSEIVERLGFIMMTELNVSHKIVESLAY